MTVSPPATISVEIGRESEDDDGIAFNYDALWYIRLIPGEKNPIDAWGGYDQDFAEAEHVYSHDEVVESDHEHWGIVGIQDLEHSARRLLIFDIDIHQASEDFDEDHVTVADDTTPLAVTQSGGFHQYTAVRGGGHNKESDFTPSVDIPFDIDIRGSRVKHHVVAPKEIPGVETEYSLVADLEIPTVADPADSCRFLSWTDDPDSDDDEDYTELLDYDPETGIDGSFEFERRDEPPEELPRCYARGLELRAENPEDHPNTHKMNTLTALCGLGAGYSVEEMIGHFAEDYPPGNDLDERKTEYHLKHMAGKGWLRPPSNSTLRDWGILGSDESCDCGIHDPTESQAVEDRGEVDVDLDPPVDEATAATDGGATTVDDPTDDDAGAPAPATDDDLPSLVEAIAENATEWFGSEDQVVTVRPVADYNLDELVDLFENDDLSDSVSLDIAMSDDISDEGRDAFSAWRDADNLDDWTVEVADLDTDPWEDIRPRFYQDDNQTRGIVKDQARRDAVAQLLAEKSILRTKEGESFLVYDEDRGFYRRDGAKAELEAYLENRLQYAYSPARAKRIIRTAGVRCAEFAEDLGGPDRQIPVANCVLDISDPSDPEPLPHTPEKWFTAGLPVEYEPEAECPRFREFVEESVDDDDLAKLQEYLGYTLLLGEQRYKKAMFLVGPTDSGKGTFLNVVEALLGEENVATETLHALTDTRWGADQLYGTAANVRNEISRGTLHNPQKFKELTGGEDRVSAEDKGESKYQFTVKQKFWFATNQFPEVKGADEAFYNRLLFVSFPNRVPDSRKDQDLDEKLIDELPGILNWALDGLARLVENGQFSDVRDQQTKESLVESFGGLAERFRHACLEVTGDDDDIAAKADVHDLALAYAEHSGLNERPSQGQFTKNLKKIQGIDDDQQRLDGESTKVYTGIRIESKALASLDVDVRYRTGDGDRSGGASVTDY